MKPTITNFKEFCRHSAEISHQNTAMFNGYTFYTEPMNDYILVWCTSDRMYPNPAPQKILTFVLNRTGEILCKLTPNIPKDCVAYQVPISKDLETLWKTYTTNIIDQINNILNAYNKEIQEHPERFPIFQNTIMQEVYTKHLNDRHILNQTQLVQHIYRKLNVTLNLPELLKLLKDPFCDFAKQRLQTRLDTKKASICNCLIALTNDFQ